MPVAIVSGFVGNAAMKLSRRRWLQRVVRSAAMALVTLGVVAAAGGEARAQARTIRFVVPFPPGGGTDIVARLLADHISRVHGPTIVVENRPGAGTVIATEAVSRAAPNGNTVLMVGNSFVINPNLKKLSYDPMISFEPICLLTTSPNVVVVHGASRYRTLADLIAAARARPGEVTTGVNGPGTSQQIGFEMLKHAAGVNLAYIPFQGGAPAVTALLGQHVDSIYSNYPTASEQIGSGKLRALAVGSRARIAPMPELPTVAESGFQDYEEDVWFGLVAPAGTPKEMITEFATWYADALQVPEIKAKLAGQGLYSVRLCGTDFAAHLRREHEKYGRIVRAANIQAQ
jgi:tripartite-type tricarboxylate transporter receptor subunit TctC